LAEEISKTVAIDWKLYIAPESTEDDFKQRMVVLLFFFLLYYCFISFCRDSVRNFADLLYIYLFKLDESINKSMQNKVDLNSFSIVLHLGNA
jgi:hypothetical protein